MLKNSRQVEICTFPPSKCSKTQKKKVKLDGRTDGRTDQLTENVTYRVMRICLEIRSKSKFVLSHLQIA